MASQAAYPELVEQEIDLAAKVLPPGRKAEAVFFGGGTPTLLAPARLGAIIAKIDESFGLAGGAEVTVEANPETVGPAELEQLRAVGVTRLSFGMQSAVPHVLRVLDREHQPGRPLDCVRWARAAGFEHVSLDLIYGTPGESDDDWRRSVAAAVEAGPDHVSAYALIVEDGTRLAAKVRRGEIAAPDDDAMADRYLIADEMLGAAGLRWYELSNWAASESAAVPAQPALLVRRELVGLRSRGAQPRGRRPLVEREAPHRLRSAAGCGPLPGRRPRAADPGRAADGGDHAPRPAGRGPAALGPHRKSQT